ncbi:MAG TPA: GNAT family N-acetyltransferase [Thermoplasmata archaeon]|nr:GNAT family N-acetyltransferase [Thermoplasmata archaeon]
MEAPRATKGAPRADLEELLQDLRRELLARDDSPTGAWVEETARELAFGAKPGWLLPGGGGLAFYTRRGGEAYGHVHVVEGPAPGERAERLATTVLEAFPPDVVSANLGFSGLSPDEERACAARLGSRPGSTVIPRLLVERSLTESDGGDAPSLPAGLRAVPVRDVTLDALADLDHRCFEGTVDAFLVGAGLEGTRTAISAMLDGRLGRFVDEASLAVIDPDPPRLVAAVLTTEQSIRRAILVDLMVDPARRRHGLGRFLVAWAFRALWALGYASVRLWVTEANLVARGLYDAVGFQTVGSATIYRWDRPSAGPQPHVAR